MKRIKAACICQTLSFQAREGTPPSEAAELAERELSNYKRQLVRSGTRYKILEEVRQPDGSILLRIIKQYNLAPVGSYLDCPPETAE